MDLHLDRKAIIGPAAEGELAGSEPAVIEGIEPARDHARRRIDRRHRSAAVVGRVAKIDLAARIAEIGGTGGGVEPPALLRELLA